MLKRISVHALTTASRTLDVERAFDLVANAYIIKPTKLQALVEMITAWHSLAQFGPFPAIQ